MERPLAELNGRCKSRVYASKEPKFGRGFTLIELLVVVALVAILAGLSLASFGYVQQKGARSRAATEVAAISAAIESFKLDRGTYPDTADLANELTINHDKVYFEMRPGMTNAQGFLADPWGDPYVYETNSEINNRGFFDFYSRGGGGDDAAKWISNF